MRQTANLPCGVRFAKLIRSLKYIDKRHHMHCLVDFQSEPQFGCVAQLVSAQS